MYKYLETKTHIFLVITHVITFFLSIFMVIFADTIRDCVKIFLSHPQYFSSNELLVLTLPYLLAISVISVAISLFLYYKKHKELPPVRVATYTISTLCFSWILAGALEYEVGINGVILFFISVLILFFIPCTAYWFRIYGRVPLIFDTLFIPIISSQIVVLVYSILLDARPSSLFPEIISNEWLWFLLFVPAILISYQYMIKRAEAQKPVWPVILKATLLTTLVIFLLTANYCFIA